MKREQYIVTVIKVPGVTRERMRYYIWDAVSSWAGQYDPIYGPLGPPCPLMDKGAVRVRSVPKRRRK